MEKFQVAPNNDITQEKYQGPNAAVAAAGEGFLRHVAWALTGALAGGILAGVAYKKASAIKEVLKDFYTANKTHNFLPKRWLAKASGGIVTLAHKMAEHFPGHKHLIKHVPEERLEAVLFGAGTLGATGYVTGWLSAIFTGTQHGNRGKEQHNKLVAALKNERERNDDLEKINDELHAKYVAAATQKEEASEQPAASEKLADANEAPHQHAAAEAEADDAPTHHPHETPEHSIHTHAEHGAHAEHHGKIHAHAQHEHAAHAHA